MAALKLTMLLEMTTGRDDSGTVRRTGGWSESVYWTSALDPTLRAQFEALCLARARVLPGAARIVGQRYQQVDPVAQAITGGVVFNGNPNWRTDIPQMALLLRIPSSDFPNIAKKKIACIPDIMVTDGEYTPDDSFRPKMQDLLQTYGLWKFKASNLNPVTFPIFTIGTDGTVSTTVVHSFTAGQIVHISRTTATYGNFVNGDFMVTAPVTSQGFKLVDWPNVATQGGTASLPTTVYPRMGAAGVVNRVTTRKIGRPSTGFVGRVGKRK